MSRKKEFSRELDQLFERRTRWLRPVIGDQKPGPLPNFTRKTVDAGIARLQRITSDAFATKLAKQEFTEHAPAKRAWQVKGHGDERKRELFDAWFEEKFGDHQKCVYVLWGKKRKCIYVGRTSGGKQ